MEKYTEPKRPISDANLNSEKLYDIASNVEKNDVSNDPDGAENLDLCVKTLPKCIKPITKADSTFQELHY